MNDPQVIFQPWKLSDAQRQELGLTETSWVEQPLKKIEFHINRSEGRGNGRGVGGGGRSGKGGNRGSTGGGFNGRSRGDKAKTQNT